MVKNLKILYIEDEEVTRNNTYELLSIIYENVYCASNGKEGLELYQEINPHIIIADIEMPFLNGLELAQIIRKDDDSTQIIITTAYTDTHYFLKAVELNLTKYLVKPVTLNELETAITKASERLNFVEDHIIDIAVNCFFNTQDRILQINNKIIKLTYKELLLLELLLRNKNNIVSYEQIESEVWDYGYASMSSIALRTLIRDLRKKLPENSIQNISKLGYKIQTI